MECDAARAAISARIDGEAELGDGGAVEDHLAGCRACRAWEDAAFDLRRVVTLRRAGPPPDLAERVLQRAGVPDPGAGEWVRYALGVVAVSLVVLNLPLLLGRVAGADIHDRRHLGAFGVALGAGLAWAAIRPERAIGMVPLAGALGVAMTIGAAVDLAAGWTSFLAEGSHLLEVVGLVLLWVLSGGRRRLGRRLDAIRRSVDARRRAGLRPL